MFRTRRPHPPAASHERTLRVETKTGPVELSPREHGGSACFHQHAQHTSRTAAARAPQGMLCAPAALELYLSRISTCLATPYCSGSGVRRCIEACCPSSPTNRHSTAHPPAKHCYPAHAPGFFSACRHLQPSSLPASPQPQQATTTGNRPSTYANPRASPHLRQELVQLVVAAQLHAAQLVGVPGVHGHRAAEKEVTVTRGRHVRTHSQGACAAGSAATPTGHETSTVRGAAWKQGADVCLGHSSTPTPRPQRISTQMCNRQRSAPHKGDVHAKAAVLAAALQAHEDAVGDGGPLRVLHLAVHAHLAAGVGAGKRYEQCTDAGRAGGRVTGRQRRWEGECAPERRVSAQSDQCAMLQHPFNHPPCSPAATAGCAAA